MRSLFALLLISGSANAVTLPPERYDRPARNVEVVELNSRRAVDKACRAMFGWMAQGIGSVEGCANAPQRIIILPSVKAIGQRRYDCILRHEMGHINGWPADHRGGRELGECW